MTPGLRRALGLALALTLPGLATADTLTTRTGSVFEGEIGRRAEAFKWSSTKLRPFSCDGVVTIPKVEFELRQVRQRPAALKVSPEIMVRPPQDKLASLKLELLVGGKPAAIGGKAKVDAEEGRSTTPTITIEVAREDYEAWISGAEAVLRLTLAATDN